MYFWLYSSTCANISNNEISIDTLNPSMFKVKALLTAQTSSFSNFHFFNHISCMYHSNYRINQTVILL